MDIISFSEAATANSRIEIINANPDSSSGIVTVPKVIASGETITIPAGRIAVLPNVQVDGTLNVEGEVFIPSGATLSGVVEKVTSTDNAIVRFDGTDGKVQNSGVIIDDNGNVGIGTSSPAFNLDIINTSTTGTTADNTIIKLKSSNRNCGYLMDTIGGVHSGSIFNYVSGVIKSQLNFDSTGNILSIFPNGGLGYGPGAGGTVTQLTSKSTAVTLNKPSGYINMSGGELAAGASATFTFNNSLLYDSDTLNIVIYSNSISTQGSYRLTWSIKTSLAYITLTNQSASALNEAPLLNFAIIKGAVS